MIEEIVKLVSFVLALLVFAALIVDSVRTKMQNNKLKANLSQETIDRLTLLEKFQEFAASQDKKSIEETQGFLKFVSDSRDAAFKYIEEVQMAIGEFDKKIGPIAKHYNKTGKILDRKPSELVKEIAEAYNDLMKSMPKENNGAEKL